MGVGTVQLPVWTLATKFAQVGFSMTGGTVIWLLTVAPGNAWLGQRKLEIVLTSGHLTNSHRNHASHVLLGHIVVLMMQAPAALVFPGHTVVQVQAPAAPVQLGNTVAVVQSDVSIVTMGCIVTAAQGIVLIVQEIITRTPVIPNAYHARLYADQAYF